MREEIGTSAAVAGKLGGAIVQVQPIGETALISVSGLVDERFAGFGKLAQNITTVVVDVSQMSRLTSFGVRQWIKANEALAITIPRVFLLGCPTFFVDQLNMVLNFGGNAQVLTVVAPYTCLSCGLESGELIDVLANRAALAKGGVPEQPCSRCGDKLEFDETPESYFSFVAKYGATSMSAETAAVLSSQGLYSSSSAVAQEKPPRVIKIVHESVTYFHVTGQIGSMFRARPYLVGAEGEVVIDLAAMTSLDPTGIHEFTRLLKTLSSRVPWVTLVDVNTGFLSTVQQILQTTPNLLLWSIVTPYRCSDCGAEVQKSITLSAPTPQQPFECSVCGGAMQCDYSVPVPRGVVPPASENLIAQRVDILAEAHAQSSVQSDGAPSTTDDTILGKYKIVRRLGTDGTMEMFLAKQVGIGGFEKMVLLKRVTASLLEGMGVSVDDYLMRVRGAGNLQHANIVQLLDIGEVNSEFYLASEYVNGPTLGAVLDHVKATGTYVPLGIALYIVREVALAVHHAYWAADLGGQRYSVAHGDLGPHTIVLGRDGIVKVTDYGFAVTRVAQIPPPQDHLNDLVALGDLLYLLCTTHRPFAANDPQRLRYVPVQQVAPDLPLSLMALIDQILGPMQVERPQTGQQIANALTEFMRSYGVEPMTGDLARLAASVPEVATTPTQPSAPPPSSNRPTQPPPSRPQTQVPAALPRPGRASQPPRSTRPSQPPDTAPVAYEFPSTSPQPYPQYPYPSTRPRWLGIPPGVVIVGVIILIAVLMYIFVRPT